MQKRLGDILVGGKAITVDARDRALARMAKVRGRFGTALLETDAVSEELLLRALCVQHGVGPATQKDLEEIRPDILRLVPGKLAQRLGVVPFRRVGRALFLAMRDPTDLPAVDEVSFLTGLPITPHVAPEVRIAQALARHYGADFDPRYSALAKKLDKPRTAPSEVGVPAAVSTPPPVPVFRERPAPTPASVPVLRERKTPPPPPPLMTPPAPPWRRGLLDGGSPWEEKVEFPDTTPPSEPAILMETFDVAPPAVPPPPPREEPPPPVREEARPPAREELPVLDDEDVKRLRGEIPIVDVTPSGTSAHVVAASVEERPEGKEEGEEELPAVPAAADLVARLAGAENRDEVAEAVLDAASAHLNRVAIFIAQRDRIIGWAARPEPPDGLRAFSLPYAKPSVFSTLRNTDGFYSGPCPDLPANHETLTALGATFPSSVVAIPVTLKTKTVLFLFGVHQETGPAPSVPDLKRLGAMTATALEILLLKNRLRNM